MFYVQDNQDNEREYKGFDDAGEAVKAYGKMKEDGYRAFSDQDIGLLITKEPIAEKSIEQVMQGDDWIAMSCVSRWHKRSPNMEYTNIAPTIQDWARSGGLSTKELSINGTTLMAELDKAGLREKGDGWDDQYTLYLAQGLNFYYNVHHMVEYAIRNNIPDWNTNKDVQAIKYGTPDEYIKAMLSLTESTAKNKGAVIMSPREAEWPEKDKIDTNREYARFIQKTGEAAMKLGLDMNVIAQAKALKYMDGYDWEFIEHSFPRYSNSKEIALLQNDLLPMLNNPNAPRPQQYEKWTDKAIAEAVIQQTANILGKAINNAQKKNGGIPQDIQQFSEYLGDVRDGLNDEKWRGVQQDAQQEFAMDNAVMSAPSQEHQKVYSAFVSALKKEQRKDSSKGVSVVDTARKVMASLSASQKQCVGNILKAKGGNTGKAVERILTREISTASRKKTKEEDRGR